MLPDDLSKLRVVDLREELTKRNLPTKGKKDELVARLREAVDNENQSASATNGATEDAKPEAVGDNEEPETNQEEQPPSESAPTDSTPSNAVPTEPAPAEGKESEPANVTTSAAPAAETSNTEETKNELEKEAATENEEAAPAYTVEEAATQNEEVAPAHTVEEAATQNEEAAPAHTVEEKTQEAPATTTATTTTTTEGNAAPANEETEQIAHRDSMDTDLERGTKRKHEAAEEKPPNVAVPAEIEQMQDTQAQPAKKVRAKPEDIGKTVDSSALYIKGFLRPLVAKRVKEQLLDKFGTVKKWWMDAIKTHCYVVYESNEEAQKAFAGIDGIEFPKGHGNKLHVEGITPEQTDIIIEQEQAAAEKRQPFDCEAALTLIRQGQILSPTTAAAEVRRPRLLGLSQINRQLQKAATGSEISPPIAAPAPAPVPPPIPAKPMPALDDLFRKTQAEPQLYYLPVPEEVAQERLSQMRGNRQRA